MANDAVKRITEALEEALKEPSEEELKERLESQEKTLIVQQEACILIFTECLRVAEDFMDDNSILLEAVISGKDRKFPDFLRQKGKAIAVKAEKLACLIESRSGRNLGASP